MKIFQKLAAMMLALALVLTLVPETNASAYSFGHPSTDFEVEGDMKVKGLKVTKNQLVRIECSDGWQCLYYDITIENNNSQDKEHLIFHPVMLENADSIVGRDGKIDFVACRINDDKVLSIKDGDDYNIINSERKGDKVPAAVLKTVADGYYAEQEESFYAGVNDKESKDSPPVNILLLCLGGIAVLSVVALTVRFIRLKSTEKKKNNILEPETEEKNSRLSIVTPDAEKEPDFFSENDDRNTDDKTVTEIEKIVSKTKAKESGEKDKIENFVYKLKKDGTLTGRELDVLGEYLKGKSRTEISEALYISESTVKNHISSIFAKTGVKNKKELLKLIELE